MVVSPHSVQTVRQALVDGWGPRWTVLNNVLFLDGVKAAEVANGETADGRETWNLFHHEPMLAERDRKIFLGSVLRRSNAIDADLAEALAPQGRALFEAFSYIALQTMLDHDLDEARWEPCEGTIKTLYDAHDTATIIRMAFPFCLFANILSLFSISQPEARVIRSTTEHDRLLRLPVSAHQRMALRSRCQQTAQQLPGAIERFLQTLPKHHWLP